jgi:hypothetical protein
MFAPAGGVSVILGELEVAIVEPFRSHVYKKGPVPPLTDAVSVTLVPTGCGGKLPPIETVSRAEMSCVKVPVLTSNESSPEYSALNVCVPGASGLTNRILA